MYRWYFHICLVFVHLLREEKRGFATVDYLSVVLRLSAFSGPGNGIEKEHHGSA